MLIEKVLRNYFITMFISFAGMLLGWQYLPPSWAPVASISVLVFLVIMFLLRMFTKRGFYLTMPIVHVLTFAMGIGIYPSIQYYTGAIGASIVLLVFGATCVLFGSLFLYSLFSKRDFTFLGGILMFGLLAVIIVSVAGFWIDLGVMEIVITFVSLLIFSGYVLYDVSRMKSDQFSERDVPNMVLSLFLSFINIFLDLLHLYNYFFNRD
jgi:uncharacterized protein